MPSLAERLGHAPDARLLLVTADGLGLCHAANVAVYDSLRTGLVTSASLMVPAPWARDAAARYRGEHVGVALTLNAKYDLYRWGPITQAPSLLDGEGGFPRTREDLWDHADIDEARRECRAQLERAIWWGFDVTHLAAHLDALQLRPEFFDIWLELAVEFRLPLRLLDTESERRAGFPFRTLASEEGIVFPDRVIDLGAGAGRRSLERTLAEAPLGVTEVVVHPALDTPELRAFAPDWAAHVDDHDTVWSDHSLPELVDRSGMTLTSYRELRDLAAS